MIPADVVFDEKLSVLELLNNIYSPFGLRSRCVACIYTNSCM